MKMTKIFAMALPVCAGALLAGCSEAAVEEGMAPEPAASTHTITAIIDNDVDDTRAYVGEGNYKVYWESGDQVSFFPAGQATPTAATLVAGYEGNDYGKFSYNGTPVSGVGFGVYPHDPDNRVTGNTINTELPAVQTYHPNSHGGHNVYMAAYAVATGDGSLTYQTYHSGLCIKLKGNGKGFKIEVASDNQALAGKVNIVTPYEPDDNDKLYPVAEVTEGSQTVTLDCSEVELTAEAQEFWVALLPGHYDKLTVRVTNINGDQEYFNRTASNRDFTRGLIKTIGKTPIEANVVNEVPVVDLSANGAYANCYIVTKAGSYKFATKHVDGTTISGNYNLVDWLWRTAGVELSDIKYESGYIYFTVKDYVKGNASIAAWDNSINGFTYQWHIWLTDQPTELTNSYGYNFLDRNLGAITNNTSSANSYGLLYQHGRKDPFYNGATGSINCRPEVNTPTWEGKGGSPYLGDWGNYRSWISWELKYQYPLSITASRHSTKEYDMCWFDYLYFSNATNLVNLWSYDKTNYDPCPAGYRVPQAANKENPQGLKIPAQGYRAYYGNYVSDDICTLATTHASASYDANGYSFINNSLGTKTFVGSSTQLSLQALDWTMGFPVRCIKIY